MEQMNEQNANYRKAKADLALDLGGAQKTKTAFEQGLSWHYLPRKVRATT